MLSVSYVMYLSIMLSPSTVPSANMALKSGSRSNSSIDGTRPVAMAYCEWLSDIILVEDEGVTVEGSPLDWPVKFVAVRRLP